MRVVRDDAPWCPWNIEFIRRINGLDDVDAVREIVFDAEYLVLGLGDVYLGAPVAVPVDPRHRLVTTKYNPARTWTPENAVGIGGAYLCIYGMEGPGGYQFVGRTVPVWSTLPDAPAPTAAEPWLLRCFDRIRWYPVERRRAARAARRRVGRAPRRCASTTAPSRGPSTRVPRPSTPRRSTRSATARRRRSPTSAPAGRRRASSRAAASRSTARRAGDHRVGPLPDGAFVVEAPLHGCVSRLLVAEGGQRSRRATAVATLEAMKTEIAVPAPSAGPWCDSCATRARSWPQARHWSWWSPMREPSTLDDRRGRALTRAWWCHRSGR